MSTETTVHDFFNRYTQALPARDAGEWQMAVLTSMSRPSGESISA